MGVILGSVASDSGLRAAAVLDDELRRGMYLFIRRARRPVTRDEAAAAVGISRKLAAFHLDKLVEAGVLAAHFRPLGGIRRVGRAPKVYEPSDVEIRISIPQREPGVLADILLDAVLSEADDERGRDAVLRVAADRGRRIGAEERAHARGGRMGAERALTVAAKVLERYGFEPFRESGTCLRLRNCPFHPLSAKAPDLVCGLNRAFIGGITSSLTKACEAILDPRAGECCIEIRPAAG